MAIRLAALFCYVTRLVWLNTFKWRLQMNFVFYPCTATKVLSHTSTRVLKSPFLSRISKQNSRIPRAIILKFLSKILEFLSKILEFLGILELRFILASNF